MGVKIRKLRGKWYLVIDHQGKRKKRVIGHDYKIADEVRRQVEAKLALGDFSLLEDRQPEPEFTFQQYSDRWLTEYAELELKPSSVIKHRQVLRLYLLPKFGQQSLSSISRDDIKSFLASLAKPANSASRRSLSRNSLRLIVCTLRVILNHAQEDGKIDSNPARKLGRFTKIDKADQQKKATALSREEAEGFLLSAQEVCPKFYPLFLTALRAGLRRGELIALEWGDIQFGASEQDSNRYILVQHNWVNGRLTSQKTESRAAWICPGNCGRRCSSLGTSVCWRLISKARRASPAISPFRPKWELSCSQRICITAISCLSWNTPAFVASGCMTYVIRSAHC